MTSIVVFLLSLSALFSLILLTIESGRRIGIRQGAGRTSDTAIGGHAPIEAAVYGLLGLILSFTFAGAAARFDARRQLVVQETNAIGTAYLRVALLPPNLQETVRQDYRDYVDARLSFYRHLGVASDAAAADDARVHMLQSKLWNESAAGASAMTTPALAALVLVSLNDVIDMSTTRSAATEIHPPVAIYIALAILVLMSSLLVGHGTAMAKERSWLHMLIFSSVMAMAIYTILDLEYPRVGLIRIQAIDHILEDQRKTM